MLYKKLNEKATNPTKHECITVPSVSTYNQSNENKILLSSFLSAAPSSGEKILFHFSSDEGAALQKFESKILFVWLFLFISYFYYESNSGIQHVIPT